MTRAMSHKESAAASALALGLLSLCLFYASALVAPLGLLAPAPLYYVLVRRGRGTGLVLMTGAGLALMIASGPGSAILFLGVCGVMALALAESFRRGDSLEKTMGTAVLWPYVSGAVLLFMAASPGGMAQVLTSFGSQTLAAYIESYHRLGVDADTMRWLEENGAWLVDVFVRVFPALSFVSVVAMAAVNLLVIRTLSLKFGWGVHGGDHEFSSWATPDSFVWTVVAGGFGMALFDGTMQTVSINLLACALTVYAIQGVSMVHWFFTKSNVPIFLRAVGYFIIFSYPLLLALLSFAGLADVWADFRKQAAERP